jgi:hypothetical protein
MKNKWKIFIIAFVALAIFDLAAPSIIDYYFSYSGKVNLLKGDVFNLNQTYNITCNQDGNWTKEVCSPSKCYEISCHG